MAAFSKISDSPGDCRLFRLSCRLQGLFCRSKGALCLSEQDYLRSEQFAHRNPVVGQREKRLQNSFDHSEERRSSSILEQAERLIVQSREQKNGRRLRTGSSRTQNLELQIWNRQFGVHSKFGSQTSQSSNRVHPNLSKFGRSAPKPPKVRRRSSA